MAKSKKFSSFITTAAIIGIILGIVAIVLMILQIFGGVIEN
ncbi:MAG TPA: hypothetical protein VJB66_02075 [Candidatus Nanoarchaeia archaeon]|nr:hypothetical protein [Candidatus Nanoarchaeia archaeon]